MRRIYGYALTAVVLSVLAADTAQAASGAKIIPETTAARHGLARPWFTQVQLDTTRGRVAHVLLDAGTLFVQTDRATLHAIDAETGQTLWVAEVGRRNHPSLCPAASSEMVAVVNGSQLYILSRHNGKLLWQREIDGAPGAGPALSEVRAYVPTTDGLIVSYFLEVIPDPAVEMGLFNPESPEDAEVLKKRRLDGLRLDQGFITPLNCQSFGRSLVQPLITRQNAGEEYIAWPTDRGYLFVGRINRKAEDRFEMRYKLETDAEITAMPSLLLPATDDPDDSAIIFAPSRDGFVHAIREKDGSSLWRFSTGEPVVEPAAPIGDKVYVPTQLGGMYCLAAQTGQELWWTPGIMRFIAAGNGRVYAEDRYGNIVVLHAETGGRLDVISTPGLPIKLMNLQTDRIYLATETGLVQCLHEIELEQPLQHRPEPAPAQPKAKPRASAAAPTAPAQQAAPAASDPFSSAAPADDPFGGGGMAPAPADDPFGGGGAAPADDPFGTPAPADDPFGGAPGIAPADDPFAGF